MEEFKEVLLNLKSVLTSNQGGLATGQLLKDYEDLVCEPLPFRRLGYRTADDFLISIPDVVTGRSNGRTIIWHAINDEATAHISELVNQQRPKIIRNRRRGGGGGQFSSSYRYSTSTQYSRPTYDNLNSNRPSLNSSFQSSTPLCSYTGYSKPLRFEKLNQSVSFQTKVVKPMLKKQIEYLLRLHPDGIASSNFADLFNFYYKLSLNPVEYGFNDINEFVLSMPEVIRVKNTGRCILLLSVSNSENNREGLKNDKSSDRGNESCIESITTLERKERKLNFREEGISWKEKDDSDDTLGCRDNFEQNQKAERNRGECQQTYLEKDKSGFDLVSYNADSEEYENSIHSSGTQEDDTLVETETRHAEYIKNSWNDSDIVENPDCPVDKRLKLELRKLMEDNPDGIKSNFLCSTYRKMYGKTLDFRQLGYVALPFMIADIPDIIFSYRESPNADWVLFDARKCKSYGVPSYTAEGCKFRKIPDVIKKAVVKLLYNKPQGIFLQDIRAEYNALYNRKLPYDDFGYHNVRDFMEKLATDTILLEDGVGGTLAKLRPDTLYNYMPALSESIVKEIKELAVSSLQPNDIVDKGEDIPLQKLPKRILKPEDSNNTYFEIVPSEIISPDEFYFFLRGMETSIALENLMDKLEFYIKKAGSDYMVPPSYFTPGQICAVLYENKDWHRARMISVNTDTVTVFYLDYGTTGEAYKYDVRLLRKEFAKLPAQAIEAKLWNVKPLGKEWSLPARKRFYGLLQGRHLIAKLLGKMIRPITKVEVLGLCLVDTTREDKKHIDIIDLLVREGHCGYFDETNEGNMNALNFPYQQLLLNTCNPMLTYPTTAADWFAYQALIANSYSMNNLFYNPFGAFYNQNQPTEKPLFNPSLPINLMQTQTTNQVFPTQTTHSSSATNLINTTTETQNYKPTESFKVKVEETKHVKEENNHLSEKSNVNNINNGLDDLCDVLEQLSIKRYVKVVKLGSHTVHLILYKKQLYMTGKEISQFIWSHNLLRIKLRLHHIKIPPVLINKSDHPDLFLELEQNDVTFPPPEPDTPHTVIFIYPFNRVPEIIDKFKPELHDVKCAIAQELDRFDPNDAYWGNSDDGISVGELSDPFDEVEVGLQVLKGRKMAIERQLMEDINQPLVNELSFLNDRILFLETGKSK